MIIIINIHIRCKQDSFAITLPRYRSVSFSRIQLMFTNGSYYQM
ncbi:hypothetical protein VPHK460_0163 [Vibrio phage K460]